LVANLAATVLPDCPPSARGQARSYSTAAPGSQRRLSGILAPLNPLMTARRGRGRLAVLFAVLLLLAPVRAWGGSEEQALRGEIARAEGAELHALLVRWKDLHKRTPAVAAKEPEVLTIDMGGDDEFDEFAAFGDAGAAAGAGVGGGKDWSLFGRFSSKIAIDTKRENRFEDYFDWRTELRFGADLEWSDDTSLRLSGEALHQLRTGDKSEWSWETDLYEAYVDHRSGAWDLRIGKQIVSWGRVDALNPTDNLNPQDYREIVTINADDRKIPITMVRGRRAVAHGHWDVIYIPFFEPDKFDIIGADFALISPGIFPAEWERVFTKIAEGFRNSRVTFSGDSLFRVDDPEEKGYNGELAARWSSRIRRVDYSLSAFYTYDDMPALSLDLGVLRRFNLRDEDTRRFLEDAEISDLARLSHIFRMEFERQWILGADFETLLGRSSLRGEAALTFDKVFYRRDLSRADRPVFNWVVGIDRTLPGNVYANLQALQVILLRYDSDIIDERVRSGITAALRRKFFDDQLNLKMSTLFFFDDGDYFLNLEADYQLGDNVGVAAGVNIFQGGRDDALLKSRTISSFTNNDQVYSRLLYHF